MTTQEHCNKEQDSCNYFQTGLQYIDNRRWLQCKYCVVDICEIVSIHVAEYKEHFGVWVDTASQSLFANCFKLESEARRYSEKLFEKIKIKGDVTVYAEN